MLFLVTIALTGVVIALWLRWRSKHFSVFKDLGIPGPEPSIFFGNMMEMYHKGPLVCQDEWVAKYGDVLGYFYGSWPCLLVTDKDMVKQVLIKDFAAFTDRPLEFFAIELDNQDHPSFNHLINYQGKRWKEVRSLITPTFTTGKLKQMIPLLHNSVSLMISKLKSKSGNGSKDVEMYELYRGMTMDAIGRAAFGVETAVQDNPNHPLIRTAKLLLEAKFKSIINVLFVSFREFNFILGPFRSLMVKLISGGKNPLDELFDVCQEVVTARKADPERKRPDLLQTLIEARSSGDVISEDSLIASSDADTTKIEKETSEKDGKNLRKLSEVEVQANALLFFIAGYETTSTAMAFLTHHMVANPDVQDKMRKEILDNFGNKAKFDYDLYFKLNYTDRVIMESLRMHPPIYFFQNRVASREVQLGKWTIPAGMTVQVPIVNMHYDPDNFEDSHTFKPDRFLPENRSKDHSVTWLPFGAGPRNCVGMRFALLEMKMALVEMLTKYRLEPSDKTDQGELKLEFRVGIMCPQNGVHLRAVPL